MTWDEIFSISPSSMFFYRSWTPMLAVSFYRWFNWCLFIHRPNFIISDGALKILITNITFFCKIVQKSNNRINLVTWIGKWKWKWTFRLSLTKRLDHSERIINWEPTRIIPSSAPFQPNLPEIFSRSSSRHHNLDLNWPKLTLLWNVSF